MGELHMRCCELLNRLGVTANYTGYAQLVYALGLCAERPDKLLFVTKQVYPDVARHFQTNWQAVERNLRTVGKIIWQENQALLEGMARRPLRQKPSNTQLLAILTSALSQYSFPA